MLFIQLLVILTSVAIGSLQHIIPIIAAIGFTVWLIQFSNKNLNQRQKERTAHLIGCFVSLTIVSFHLYQIGFNSYNFKTDLPLFLCSFMALIIPIFTYYRKYWMFEILVFWIIGGTLQASLTPDIPIGFPSFDYFRYWIAHLGLLSIVFYFIFVFKMRPKLKSVFKSFLTLQVYVILMIALNYLLDANYFYLNEKPKSASILDYFGEWPFYIMVVQVLIIPVFLLIYMGFYLSARKEKSLSK